MATFLACSRRIFCFIRWKSLQETPLWMQNSYSRLSRKEYSSSRQIFPFRFYEVDLDNDDPYITSCLFCSPSSSVGSSRSIWVGPKSLKPEPQSARLKLLTPVDLRCDSMYFSIWSRLVRPFERKNLSCSMTSRIIRSLIRLFTIRWWSSSVLKRAKIFIELMMSRSSLVLFRSYFCCLLRSSSPRSITNFFLLILSSSLAL
mmetsp:Transcript_12026/g.20297  ORF Transcript_12026/g.20297 Transcript_12026/m.20297 type:complete len:202 (-) Transcript_12026:124-729(-)